MDVPEMVLVAVLEPIQALRMLTPGAQTSTTEPKLEKEAFLLEESTAPTVFAEAARAGDVVEASTFELPAATVK